MAVTGKNCLLCAAAMVMTAVIVPGLAAKRMRGVSDTLLCSVEGIFVVSFDFGINILAPIQTRIPPPAHENAIIETPNAERIAIPKKDEAKSTIPIAAVAFTASLILSFRGKCPAIRVKISVHTKGLIRARIVTTA